MNNILNVKIIKLLINIFETFQANFNIDIYSILRIKKGNNNKFLEEIFLKSHDKWLIEYHKQTEHKIIHNIALNYWIRSHAAYKYYKKI